MNPANKTRCAKAACVLTRIAWLRAKVSFLPTKPVWVKRGLMKPAPKMPNAKLVFVTKANALINALSLDVLKHTMFVVLRTVFRSKRLGPNVTKTGIVRLGITAAAVFAQRANARWVSAAIVLQNVNMGVAVKTTVNVAVMTNVAGIIIVAVMDRGEEYVTRLSSEMLRASSPRSV